MSQNVSECIKMYAEWIVKMFGRIIITKVPLWHSNGLKLGLLAPKIAHLLLNAQNASIYIRIHQNVCRMNCAKVFCMKFYRSEKLYFLKGWTFSFLEYSDKNNRGYHPIPVASLIIRTHLLNIYEVLSTPLLRFLTCFDNTLCETFLIK